MAKSFTVTITGFKTLAEAKKWASAYEGGVEQDMSVWAEVNGDEPAFPCMTKKITKKGNTIELELE